MIPVAAPLRMIERGPVCGSADKHQGGAIFLEACSLTAWSHAGLTAAGMAAICIEDGSSAWNFGSHNALFATPCR